MQHRYGRHGQQAWLRWFKHRYIRPKRSYIPVVREPITVQLYIPPQTERVIFIVLRPADDFNDREGEEEIEASYGHRQLEPVGERSEINAVLQKKAEFEARTKYDSDLQNVLDRGGEWPTDKTLEREASNKANVALRPYIETDIDMDASKQFYIRHYLRTYRVAYERDTGNKTLPNENTKQVQHVAQQDAATDKQDGMELSSEIELNYQAVIRIQELFGYRTRASSGYLTHIMDHIPVYKQAYREEKERLSRGPFLR